MGMQRGGGGGFSGKIDFPNYMRNAHEDLLDISDNLVAITVAGASPYNAAFAYDPDTDVDAVQDKIDTYFELAEAVTPSDDIGEFFTDAAAFVDAELLSDDYIDDLTDAYEVTNKPAYLRSISRFTGGMSDINAVHNSSFIIGLALEEESFNNQLEGFSAGLKQQRDQLRTNAVMTLASMMVTVYQMKLQSTANSANMQQEQGRFTVAAKQNQYDKDLELDVRDVLFDFDVLDRGGMVLGAINGAPAAPNPPGPIQQMGSMGLSTISSLLPLLGML